MKIGLRTIILKYYQPSVELKVACRMKSVKQIHIPNFVTKRIQVDSEILTTQDPHGIQLEKKKEKTTLKCEECVA